jgi:hypothetical protein
MEQFSLGVGEEGADGLVVSARGRLLAARAGPPRSRALAWVWGFMGFV